MKEVLFKNLVDTTYEELHQTFVDAFSDYALDISYMTPQIMKNRAIKNGYDPESSVGVYSNGKMVGFTLVGIDKHYERPAAFDIATGIVKSFRGNGIAARMFDFIKPKLAEKKIEVFYLEVLQQNISAIKAYKKAGFQINRKLDCFILDIQNFKINEPLRIPLQFIQIDRSAIDEYETFGDWTPSWENSFNAIKRM
jgi:ribosomal protein S18 acetylase RimI-like enzyme